MVTDDRPLLILVAGKDPDTEPGGGHSLYVLAHARAAIAAGWWPQILCVGATADRRETDYGTVRRFHTPYRPLRQLMIRGHARVLASAIVELAGETSGPVLAHGFGVWGAGAVGGVERLRAGGRQAAAAISSYTTYKIEHDSLVRAARTSPWWVRLRYRAQAAWVSLVVERVERRAYRAADRVWVNYDSVARMIEERHGGDVPVERIAYGPELGFLPIPDELALPPEVATLGDPDAPLVVCVARHHSRKGIDVLIDALAILARDGVRFRAALPGFGPLVGAHRRKVASLGLSRTVSVPGGVPSVEPYLAAADVFVLPSRHEQSGSLAILEAFRMGVPVLATRVDGVPEDVTDGDTGLLVPPDDPAALAGALRRLLADPDLRHRLGNAARAAFEARFASGPFIAGLIDAYAGLGFPLPRGGPGRRD